MNRLALAVAAAVLSLTGSASAADLAARPYTKAPAVAAAPVYDWSGMYVGGAAGGAWHTTSGDFYNAFPPGFFWRTDSRSDWIAGGFAGIQKQWSNFVLGVEGGWNALGNSFASTVAGGFGTSCGLVPVVESCRSRIADIGYIGGRAGFAWDRWMVYGQGGYARARIETDVFMNAAAFGLPAGAAVSAVKADHSGWYAGAGFDYAVLDYLILGVDYKHYQFDSVRHDCDAACFTAFLDNRNVSAKADSVMGRVSFKFNPWPAVPVVAKY